MEFQDYLKNKEQIKKAISTISFLNTGISHKYTFDGSSDNLSILG